ncbi:hypothetical protein KC332_g11623 [Hortaea werneckii]|uniref:Uncharacterized protein n=1 Tax=Hortaea werneckii TaxID=91943 RepID=A0A3M7IIY6_HORWE|nr:hypothetical protein KC350_g2934 [Hortaea werneckii]KAI6991191.1 hypothetical protein KC329_g4318 [Hortaea werneckii]KAI7024964.1 hypothetical protein KC366_g12151 [Hortaea werneckii]KAI7064106.1 hypothetical protein KC327_g12401 [Hortaea werneckii]KAI7134404.1 hypothetical protein KC337_g3845 [Hortaea werneckii]
MAISGEGRDMMLENASSAVTYSIGTPKKRTELDRQERSNVVVSGRPKRWRIDVQLPDLRESLESLEQLWQDKDKRLKVLRTLSNPWPKERHPLHNEHFTPSDTITRSELPEANAAPVPPDVFRQRLLSAHSDKGARQVIRTQLLRCETPRDINRVVAAALVLGRPARLHLAALHEPIMRALYRCRNNVSDSAILDCLSGLRSRFSIYGIPFDPQFIQLGLKFAARTRSVKGMKKYLHALKERRAKMTSNVFRAIIAKFSIGHRGLGEIRNGRWRRADLLQVLTGFDDCKHLPPEEQYHLETFLDREDWQYLHGWIAVLARCRHTDAIWREWERWKVSESRIHPKPLASAHCFNTTRLRGDYWFLEQMTYSGGLREAWLILAESEIDFGALKKRIRDCLLEGVEHAGICWSETIRQDIVRKYDTDLRKVEAALGVRWVPSPGSGDSGEGHHELTEDQWTVMERLAAKDFKLEEDFGYPYDGEGEEGIVPLRDRPLHDAEELEEEKPKRPWVRVKMHGGP